MPAVTELPDMPINLGNETFRKRGGYQQEGGGSFLKGPCTLCADVDTFCGLNLSNLLKNESAKT